MHHKEVQVKESGIYVGKTKGHIKQKHFDSTVSLDFKKKHSHSQCQLFFLGTILPTTEALFIYLKG